MTARTNRCEQSLDSVTFQSPYGHTHCCDGPFSIEWDGFYWQITVDDTQGVGSRGDVAVGKRDGRSVARGFVEQLDVTHDGDIAVTVGPPNMSELHSSHGVI